MSRSKNSDLDAALERAAATAEESERIRWLRHFDEEAAHKAADRLVEDTRKSGCIVVLLPGLVALLALAISRLA